MDLGLRGKTIAIVGGTTGMGFAAAEVMAEEGAHLALVARDAGRGEQKAAALRGLGATARAYGADGKAGGDIDAAFQRIAEDFGGVDGLVVTAGPMLDLAPFLEFPDAGWADYFDGLVMLTVRACRAAIPLMEARGGGTIVTTAAVSLREQKPTNAPYTAMKAAVASLSKNLAKHHAATGVRVNCIAPGGCVTEAAEAVAAEVLERYGPPLDRALYAYAAQEWNMHVAMGRLAQPREIGELIAFLSSERAGYMTGALINIDGGTDF